MPKSAKLIIGVLIIACIAPLFIKGPDGKPIMTIDDWIPEVPESAEKLAGNIADEVVPTEPTRVYKWQDEDGQWHFSNTPPNALASEEMELDGDINIMDPFEVPEEEEEVASGGMEMPSNPFMTASPDQVEEMMETVNGLQGTLDDRAAEIDKLTNPNKN